LSLFKHGRYIGYLRPLSYIIDLSIIVGLAVFYYFKSIDPFMFIVFASIGWVMLSINSKFYEVYRFTRVVTILSLIIRQAILFTLMVFAFSGFYSDLNIRPLVILKYILSVFFLISIVKFTIYFLLKRYRKAFGGNVRTTVIIGKNLKTAQLERLFKFNQEYGYSHKKTFNLKDKVLTNLDTCFEYIVNNKIEEIYCSISELSNKQITEVIDFADNNLKILKFLPDNKDIYAKKLKYEYYDYTPILSLREIPFEDPINKIVKRIFDIVFAALIIIFVLSWLTPLIAILIKLESRGSVFFKQSRNGINYKEFDCYKFRSMTPNKDANLFQATRGDQRITKIGKFIRKTSVDELPQFFNVLFGDMSVVGPRPHMVSHTDMYAKRIDKFMVRHFVKPGITGMAQVKGFRGEIETDKDIINRVKYDIFYIENWSLLLDLKIIFQTFFNAVKGEEKAY